jgi:hypothetical protein
MILAKTIIRYSAGPGKIPWLAVKNAEVFRKNTLDKEPGVCYNTRVIKKAEHPPHR